MGGERYDKKEDGQVPLDGVKNELYPFLTNHDGLIYIISLKYAHQQYHVNLSQRLIHPL